MSNDPTSSILSLRMQTARLEGVGDGLSWVGLETCCVSSLTATMTNGHHTNSGSMGR